MAYNFPAPMAEMQSEFLRKHIQHILRVSYQSLIWAVFVFKTMS